jgi:hypothetical protein
MPNAALEAWDESFSSFHSESSDGLNQATAAPPFELPPIENAPASNTENGMSDSIHWSVMIVGYILFSSSMSTSFYDLLFFLF